MSPKTVGVLVVTFVFVLFILMINPFTVIQSQQVGIITKFGAIDGTVGEGLHLINPFTTDIVKMDISTLKEETSASAASKDSQTVSTVVAVNYKIQQDKVIDVYRAYRKDYVTIKIQPAIQEAVKAATAKYTAEELITKREEVKGVMFDDLRNRLASDSIIVTELMITNFDFSAQFNAAIEAKVTAEQEAQKAKNDLARVEFEAQQQIERAKAEAEAIRIQAEAVTSQGGKDYVQLKAIEKWNGQLPNQFVPGSAVPFINLSN